VSPHLRKLVAGTPPDVPLWHPAWLDYRLLRELLKREERSIKEGRACHVSVGQDLAGPAFAVDAKWRMEDLPAGGVSSRDLVLIEVSADRMSEIRSAIERVHAVPGAQIAVFVKDPGPRSGYLDLGPPLIGQIEKVAPRDLRRAKVLYAGGAVRLSLHWLGEGSIALYRKHGALALPVTVAGLALCGLLVCANNLLQSRLRDPRKPVSPCTSFLMTLDV
jgi:hypothetical protein